MKHLIVFILNRIGYYIQEISYARSDFRMWNLGRKRDRVFKKKYIAICKKAGIKP